MPTIIKHERQEQILQLVNQRGVISTSELCNLVSASQATIRRDIIKLDEKRKIKKTHGGAAALTKSATDDLPINLRLSLCSDEKARIAAEALSLIKDSETIYLDSGTTTLALATKLNIFKNLMIITNDINIAREIATNSENGLIVAGGVLKKSTATLSGMFTEQMLAQFHVDKSFLASDAINCESGYMDYNTAEIPIKRLMIKNAQMRIMLCDHSKFENTAFMSICPLTSIDLTITGNEIDSSILTKMLDFDVNIRTV